MDLSELTEAYYAEIEALAEARQSPQFALCMIGLIGAGKSTVLRALTKALPIVAISGDAVRKIAKEKGLPELTPEQTADINGEIVSRFVKEGYRVAYDNDFANPSIRTLRRERDKALKLPEIWVRVTAPEDVIIRRLQKRPLGHFPNMEAVTRSFYERKALHEAQSIELATLPYVYIFDTSLPNLDQQVIDAAAAIKRQLAIK